MEKKKRKTKFPTLVLGVPPPKDSGFHPCQKVLTRLDNLEFVELWFFTFTSCHITKDAALADKDGTLSLTQENGNIQLQRSSTIVSYKHLIAPDEKFTWKDLLQAKNVFLECIAKSSWPETYLEMFTSFYCTLEMWNELRQAHRHSEKILILYHARARWEWFDSAAQNKNLFNISVINDDWMSQAHKELWDNVHMQEIQRFQEKVKSNLFS